MAKTIAGHPTLTVYPHPRARSLVAWSSPAANRALERWGDLLMRADLAALSPKDWRYLADSLNGMIVDAQWDRESLDLQVADSDRLDGLGSKWYGARGAKRGVAALRAKIGKLSRVDVLALATAVEWFWDRHEEIADVRAAAWWTPEFRLQHSQGKATD